MTLNDVQKTYLAILKELYYVVSESRNIWAKFEGIVTQTEFRGQLRWRKQTDRRRRARLEKIFWGLDIGRGAYGESPEFERLLGEVEAICRSSASGSGVERPALEVLNRLNDFERERYTALRDCAERLGRLKDVELIEEAIEEAFSSTATSSVQAVSSLIAGNERQ